MSTRSRRARTTPCSCPGCSSWTCSSSTPLQDGNGRVARLLTNAMLSEHGYTVGRYVSLEQPIAESADAYYQALLDSTHGLAGGHRRPVALARLLHQRDRRRLRRLRRSRGPRPGPQGPSSNESASTSCATHPPRSASSTSGRQCQVSVTRPSGSSWNSSGTKVRSGSTNRPLRDPRPGRIPHLPNNRPAPAFRPYPRKEFPAQEGCGSMAALLLSVIRSPFVHDVPIR